MDKPKSPDRAVLFIDGSNWYHSLKENGVFGALDYVRISEKLVGPARSWIGTRYYVGAVKQSHSDYSQQRRFLSLLKQQDPARISVHLGRVEEQPKRNPLADEILHLVGRWPSLDRDFRKELVELVDKYRFISHFKEKAADVFLAVDMCRLAFENRYDAAYLLSADGDFTPAVDFVRSSGKKVYSASLNQCLALGYEGRIFIPLSPDWFDDCRV